MQELIELFFKKARRFRTTESIILDIKAIKKVNNLITKFLRSDNERKYYEEVINTFISMNNSYKLMDVINQIKELYIDEENKQFFDELIDEYKRRRDRNNDR